VLLTLTYTRAPARDLGYLLFKNPARVHQRRLAFGTVYVFYPEATDERCTAALLLDIDPVGLVRRGPGARALEQYVNDRPYVASSFLSVAIADAFGKRDDLDLMHRILHALEAGESTGADKKDAVSATITVVDTETYPLWDVRVDEAEDPVAELRRLAKQFAEELLPQIKKLPTREDALGEAAREDGVGIG
jgi:hypothetical protein